MKTSLVKRISAVMALILCLSLVGAFSGCSKPDVEEEEQESFSSAETLPDVPSPSDTVKTLMEGIRTLDTEMIKSAVTKNEVNALINTDGLVSFSINGNDSNDSTDITLDPNSGDMPDVAKNYANAILYEISSEEIKGNYAYVDVIVKTPNLSDIIGKLVGEIIKHAALQVFQGNEVDYEAYVMDYLNNEVDFTSLTKMDLSAKIKLVLENGEWLVMNNTDENKELLDGLSGGMANFVNDLLSHMNF